MADRQSRQTGKGRQTPDFSSHALSFTSHVIKLIYFFNFFYCVQTKVLEDKDLTCNISVS